MVDSLGHVGMIVYGHMLNENCRDAHICRDAHMRITPFQSVAWLQAAHPRPEGSDLCQFFHAVYAMYAMWMPCGCHVDAMWMPCGCHVDAMWMPCGCHVISVDVSSLKAPCLVKNMQIRAVSTFRSHMGSLFRTVYYAHVRLSQR